MVNCVLSDVLLLKLIQPLYLTFIKYSIYLVGVTYWWLWKAHADPGGAECGRSQGGVRVEAEPE